MRLGAVGFAVVFAFSQVASAKGEESGPREIVEQGIAAHGGDFWLEPETLQLSGSAVFYSPNQSIPRSTADDYRMWRAMGATRTNAHQAEGKVRITAKAGETVLFEVGYNGETTWTDKGIMPKSEADAFWGSNFGFGIIRSALDEGFRLESVPPRDVDGALVDMVRIIDPQGQATLFGFDRDSRFIRYMGFRTERGWHERTYADFIRLPESGWVQARSVKLFYDGVLSNTVFWTDVIIGEPLPSELFDPPALSK